MSTVYVMDVMELTLPPVSQQDEESAMRAGALLVEHIMTMVPEKAFDSLESLQALPLRDRVGAMLLLKTVMILAIAAHCPGFLNACDSAGHIYSLIGLSTGLEPTMKTDELLQQLETRENK